LLAIFSVSLPYPLQLINAQTSELNSVQSNESAATEWKVYANGRFGFSIEYPRSWIVEEKQNRFDRGFEVVIQSPQFPSKDGGFFFTTPERAPTDNITEFNESFP
jgi:hypothetical protein